MAAADRLADPGRVGELAGVAHGRGDGVGDPDGGLGVAGGGDREQLAGLAQFGLGAGLGVEPAAPQRGAAAAIGAWRKFELVIPAAVDRAPGSVAAPQFRAVLPEPLAALRQPHCL